MAKHRIEEVRKIRHMNRKSNTTLNVVTGAFGL